MSDWPADSLVAQIWWRCEIFDNLLFCRLALAIPTAKEIVPQAEVPAQIHHEPGVKCQQGEEQGRPAPLPGEAKGAQQGIHAVSSIHGGAQSLYPPAESMLQGCKTKRCRPVSKVHLPVQAKVEALEESMQELQDSRAQMRLMSEAHKQQEAALADQVSQLQLERNLLHVSSRR